VFHCGDAGIGGFPAVRRRSFGDRSNGYGNRADKTVTGNIMIYTSIYEDIVTMMDNALAEKFPNCNIEFFQGGTGKIQTKVAGEMATGKLGCDMMVAEPAYSLELNEDGYLHKYLSRTRQSPVRLRQGRACIPVRVCNMVLAYNPEMYKPSDLATRTRISPPIPH
jgi:iron(III) transport system substrate-binding protein